MTDPAPRTLAERIADDLFTNGFKQAGHRLVITDTEGRNLGGWCRQAVADRIAALLPPAPDAGLLREAAGAAVRLDSLMAAAGMSPRPDYMSLAARLRAAASRTGACAHGWVEVTDDPATWPPESLEDSPILVESESDGFEATVLRGWMLRRRLASSPPYVGRWMPWPASPAKEAT